jgi:hypothetical protein
MSVIQQTYNSLLQDIAVITGIPEIRETSDNRDWLLSKSPLVERALLSALEGRPYSSECVPSSLRRLFLRAVAGDANSVRCVRQICLFAYKAKEPHDKQSMEASLQKWREVNDGCRSFDSVYRFQEDVVLRRAKSYIQEVLRKADFKEIVPYHGPGAIYEKAARKGDWTVYEPDLDAVYPYSDYFYTKSVEAPHAAYVSGQKRLKNDSLRSRICAVPKDSRGPRLIAVHSAEAIWIQQGLWRALQLAIARSPGYMKPKWHIHFEDQTINGRLAVHSSRTRRYATLDLSDASDRLTEGLVRYLFGDYYTFFEACRAKYMRIGSEMIPISCYAPMGNATTFPVQSLVYWALCVSLHMSLGLKRPTDVWVFGDDIIVPRESFEFITQWLPQYNLRVNTSKCFSNGFFRESCGHDAFKGVMVTPVRWKLPMSDPRSPTDLVSGCDLAKRLLLAGYTEASATLYACIRKVLYDHHGRKRLFITNNPDHGGIAEYTKCLTSAAENAFWHSELHKYCTHVWRPSYGQISDPHDRCHVLTSISSLIRTNSGCDPATRSFTKRSLNRGWVDLVVPDVEIRRCLEWLLLAEKLRPLQGHSQLLTN